MTHKIITLPSLLPFANMLPGTLRGPPTRGFGRGISSSLVILNRATSSSLGPFGNSIFAALVASTFFANAAANSTHAKIRPIVFMLGPVYHQPGVLIDTDRSFFSRSTFSPLSLHRHHRVDCTVGARWGDCTQYVLFEHARGAVWFALTNTERFEPERELPDRLRADVLRNSFGSSAALRRC